MRKKILVTGATGFVGGALVQALASLEAVDVIAATRRKLDNLSPVGSFFIPELSPALDWSEVLCGTDTVIHVAARTHIMNEVDSNPLAVYRYVNVGATLNLADQAAKSGVRRFIYISSIKVNGEETPSRKAFNADDIPNPKDPYGISKAEAEEALQVLSQKSGMELVIIRPPLVYGPGVKGNFASLLRLAGKGIPLPFGAVNNARSLVALDNLVDLIVRCVSHPKAAGQVFLVSDGKPVSTTELLRGIAAAMNKRCWLLPVPEWVFRAGLGLLGKKAIVDRLFGSLVVDIAHTKETLDWEPPISLEEGLRRAIEPSKN